MVHSLVLIEHNGRVVKRGSLAAIRLARQLGGSYSLLVVGDGIAPVAESLRRLGAASVLAADHEALIEPLADRYAMVVAQAARSVSAECVLGTASTYTKDILPRVAALLDAPMVSEVMALENRNGEICYQRLAAAGSLCALVQVEGTPLVLTARGASFSIPEPEGEECPVERLPVDATRFPDGMQFLGRVQTTTARPDLTEARVVVSGGRPLRDAATFERLVGGLADALGGAVGATRAAVDAGLAPNDCQVGQTGKTVAPELYIALGVSGAIQHWAGIKDSKVIVAINKDPEAPIFQIATYGLVGDLHELAPELLREVRT